MISSTNLPHIYRQSLVRRPVFSLVRLLVRPWPYRVAPAAGESLAPIYAPSHSRYAISLHLMYGPPANSQYSQQQLTAHIRVPSGPFGLAEQGRYSSCRYNEGPLIDVTVVRRVRRRAERRYHAYHNVRTYRFLPDDTRYIRIWNITYVSYVYTYLVHTPESEKSSRRYISSNGKSKRKCWYIYQVREQTIFYPNDP